MLVGVELGLLALASAVYGGLAFRRRPSPLQARSAALACFAAGVATIAVAVIALGGPEHQLLYPEVIQNLLIGDVGALLIALGCQLLPSPRRGPSSTRRFATRLLLDPRLALLVWGALTVVWYLPGPHDAALHSWPLQLFEHVLLLFSGVIAWGALIHILRAPSPLRIGAAGVYLLVWRGAQSALAITAIWSKNVYYHPYIHSEVARAISPLADQGTAGSIMLGEGALAAVCVIAWVYWRLGSARYVRRAGAAHLDSTTSRGLALDSGRIGRPSR